MDKPGNNKNQTKARLRRGWTTGACATAASKSALSALLGHGFIDPVQISLPGGQQPAFVLAHEQIGVDERGKEFAEAGIIKDAGDDPDVTHGAMIIARVSLDKNAIEKNEAETNGSAIRFFAGAGVGTITKPGLPLPVGEPAINPKPREMITSALRQICATHGCSWDINVTIGVPQGQQLAQKTWNPRLGILGGISILGTTGIVVPYSCSAWIHSIHSGINVARALGLRHIVGATGDRSEKAARTHLGLANEAYIDMGDFVGGLLKYARKNPVEKITITGGFAKLSKLACGAMDLHSGRSQVDLNWLSEQLGKLGADDKLKVRARHANSANEILQMAHEHSLDIAAIVAEKAAEQAKMILKCPQTGIGIIVIDRQGEIIAQLA